MPRKLTDAECTQLELLIDSTSLAAVTDALATICSDKADHVLETWQDKQQSLAWALASTRLESLTVFAQERAL